MKKTLLAIAALLCLAAAQAQQPWSLDSCLNYAAQHNIQLRRQQVRVDQARLAVTEARDRYLPQASASAGQSWNFGRGLTADNTYANRNTSNTQWNVGLDLPLFQGLSAYRREQVAKLSLQQYVLDAAATRDNIQLNIISQYLQVLYNRELTEAARHQAELSAFQLERQRALAQEGKVAEATVYDFEAQNAQDRLQIVTSLNDTQAALVSLAAMLQLPSADGFDIAPLDDRSLPLPAAETVYRAAMAGNNSILALRQGIKVAEANISLAKTGWIPTLSFNAGLGSNFYTMAGMPHETFGSQMRHNFSRYLGFSLRIPLFDGFTTRNNLRQARLQRLDAQLALEQQGADLQRDIMLAWTQADGARERYITAARTLEATRLSFDSTRERYDLGRATIADYETARNSLYRTEISLIQARYEYLIRTRILEFYANPRP